MSDFKFVSTTLRAKCNKKTSNIKLEKAAERETAVDQTDFYLIQFVPVKVIMRVSKLFLRLRPGVCYIFIQDFYYEPRVVQFEQLPKKNCQPRKIITIFYNQRYCDFGLIAAIKFIANCEIQKNENNVQNKYNTKKNCNGGGTFDCGEN